MAGPPSWAERTSGPPDLWISGCRIARIPLAYPTWYPSLDLWPARAVATRHALFNRAAAANYLVLGCNFPFPGLGYVRRKQAGWQWEHLKAPPPALPSTRSIPSRLA